MPEPIPETIEITQLNEDEEKPSLQVTVQATLSDDTDETFSFSVTTSGERMLIWPETGLPFFDDACELEIRKRLRDAGFHIHHEA